jgi:hypothetical protein
LKADISAYSALVAFVESSGSVIRDTDQVLEAARRVPMASMMTPIFQTRYILKHASSAWLAAVLCDKSETAEVDEQRQTGSSCVK